MQRLFMPANWEATTSARFGTLGKFWAQRREAALNWLAFGLLLAAWNAADNDAGEKNLRPHTLRGYSCVSVRAATRAGVSMDR
jgi:hypothetical protein